MTYRGSCHCGRVRIEVEGEVAGVVECNCSMCTRKGYLHWIVPRSAFRLLTPESELSTYTFNTGVAKHHFCGTCGISPFYIPRSDPDKVDVNVRCLQGVDLSHLEVASFDGQNWEAAQAQRRGHAS
ncbi:MAG: GFA family protein [Deltaproteobacteria bacterium]|nr:GFA family protein [Deltaproteobacteria bacterium]